MIVDINGVPHYFWRGKLYPGGVTPPPGPSDGAPLPPEVLQAIADHQGRFGPHMYSSGPTYRNVRGCETSHFLTSPLSAEQQHLNMINHLKGLHGLRGS